MENVNSENKNRGKRKAKWQNDYIKRNYDRINLTVVKGQKEVLKKIAKQNDNGSVNCFINRAIKKLIEEEINIKWKM